MRELDGHALVSQARCRAAPDEHLIKRVEHKDLFRTQITGSEGVHLVHLPVATQVRAAKEARIGAMQRDKTRWPVPLLPVG